MIQSETSKCIQKQKLKKIQQDLDFILYAAYKIRKSLSLLQHTKYYVFVEDLPSNSEIKQTVDRTQTYCRSSGCQFVATHCVVVIFQCTTFLPLQSKIYRHRINVRLKLTKQNAISRQYALIVQRKRPGIFPN